MLVTDTLSISCDIVQGEYHRNFMLVSIGSDSSLTSSGNKPLPKPTLGKMYDAVKHHLAAVS